MEPELYGRYVLLERLAKGGMAEVFRAATLGSSGFARQVAVKRLLPHLSDDEKSAEMLVSEAKLVAGLNHPNIVRVLDLGEEQGRHFIAMDFVAGQPLQAIIERCRTLNETLPRRFAIHAVEEALAGLAHAHQKRDEQDEPLNIIHRDISPQNVMVSYDGDVLLVDFGIAKGAHRTNETQVGLLKGKPAYFCPEIVRGSEVTQAVDLFAMGVVLHELLTMKPMRVAKSEVEMLMLVMNGGFPHFEDVGVPVPPPLSQLVYRSLDNEPLSRFSDATTMRDALVSVKKQLQWEWSRDQTKELLGRLFADEIEAEFNAQARFKPLVDRLSRARPADVPNMLRPRPKTWRMAAAAAVGGALIMAAAVAGFSSDPPAAPAPAPVAAPAPVIVTTPAAPQLAQVQVRSTPPRASVELDGQMIGKTPLRVTVLHGKPAHLVLRLDGHQPHEQDVTEKDEPKGVDVTLVSTRPPRKAPAVVSSEPALLWLQSKPWARVMIDGKDTGEFTPLVEVPLSPGKHTITLINDEVGKRQTFTVEAAAGQKLNLSRTLK